MVLCPTTDRIEEAAGYATTAGHTILTFQNWKLDLIAIDLSQRAENAAQAGPPTAPCIARVRVERRRDAVLITVMQVVSGPARLPGK